MTAFKDDRSLLESIARGDSTGLGELYDRYKTLVFSIAFHILGSREDAEEATLDVFSKVWERAADYNARKATVKTWLTRIARNRAIDLLRRRNARFTGQNPAWADACLECMPGSDDPAGHLEKAELHQEVTRALARLPENQREALSLAYFRGFTHSQIAEALAEPLGTVKTRIRSALQTLRNSMLRDKKAGSVKSNQR